MCFKASHPAQDITRCLLLSSWCLTCCKREESKWSLCCCSKSFCCSWHTHTNIHTHKETHRPAEQREKWSTEKEGKHRMSNKCLSHKYMDKRGKWVVEEFLENKFIKRQTDRQYSSSGAATEVEYKRWKQINLPHVLLSPLPGCQTALPPGKKA